jgi:hypothetical protein
MSQYQLKYGKATATVNSVGGELASYVAANGKNYIWEGDPAIWASHSPVLFPVVGTTITAKLKSKVKNMKFRSTASPVSWNSSLVNTGMILWNTH